MLACGAFAHTVAGCEWEEITQMDYFCNIYGEWEALISENSVKKLSEKSG